jgi:pimeloyl-ACP methyl ester carboxylesterase
MALTLLSTHVHSEVTVQVEFPEHSSQASTPAFSTTRQLNISGDNTVAPANRAFFFENIRKAIRRSLCAFGTVGCQKEWNVETEHEIVLIHNDGLPIPIQTVEPRIVLEHDSGSVFSFTDEGMSSATLNKSVAFTTPSGVPPTFSKRPTLFITIPGFNGFQGGNFNKGEDTQPWQHNVDSVINATVTQYQYKHLAVDWQSTRSNRTQVRDVASLVKNYLKNKTYKWDVVVIGHSRGGVFAHELSKKLVNMSKVNSVHSTLLDPTASTAAHGDHYPRRRVRGSNDYYGTLLYNGTPFDDKYTQMKVGTVSDENIPGYNNYGRNDFRRSFKHGDFPYAWISDSSAGLNRLLDDVLAKKSNGSYLLEEGYGGMDVIKVRTPEDIYLSGEIDIGKDHVEIAAQLQLGPSVAHARIYADGNGVEASAGVIIAAAQVGITKDKAYFESNNLISSYSASLDRDKIAVEVNVVGISSGASIGNGGISVGGGYPGVVDAGVKADSSGVSVKLGKISFKIRKPW